MTKHAGLFGDITDTLQKFAELVQEARTWN